VQITKEKIKILIADDELPIREWLNYSITSLDDNVELVGVCKDGNEALAAYIKLNPDICIMDIKMPNMNGIELLKNIKDYNDKAYVIMLTSHDDFELARESLKFGASEYILKNEVTIDVLKGIVHNFTQKTQHKTKSKFIYDDSIIIKEVLSGDALGEQRFINELGVFNDDQFVLMAHIKPRSNASLFENLGYKLDCILSGHIYKYDKNKIVFIVQLMHSNSHIEKYNCILSLAKEIEGLSESPVGVSEMLCKTTQIEKAIRSSLFALGISYYDEKPNCMYTSAKVDNGNDLKEIIAKRNKIIELITIMNFKKAKTAIEDLLVYIKKVKFEDVDSVKLALVDFIISYKFTKLKFSSENLSEKVAQYQDEILGATRIVDMESIMNAFITSAFKVEDISGGHYSKYVNRAIAYIRENYATIERIQEISDYLGLNLEYLCRLFKSETGDTVNNLLTNQRLKIASHLLMTTDLKVNEIAEQVGYNSLSYFSRTFRKKMNQSPHDYRADLKKSD